MKKRKSFLKNIYVFLMVLALFVNCLTVGTNVQEIKAADTNQEVSNLVVFVRFSDDTRDIYNAVYDSGSYTRSNWNLIKNMYEYNPNHDYTEDVDYDNSFKNYISTISNGKVNVTNYFPQEYADETGVVTYTLLEAEASYTSGTMIVAEVVNALSDGSIPLPDISAEDLCNVDAGCIDALTIVIQGESSGRESPIHPHKAMYGGSETVLGLKVNNYIIMPSGSLVSDDASISMGGQQEQGVIAHEFLHVLGFPDLYRYEDDGVPVGAWDVMANNNIFLQYPLSYLRAQEGWVDMNWITTSGTYTLTAVSEDGGNQVYAIKTPLSDSEYIVLEYRKQEDSLYAFEHRIPSSGLLMYRVDDKVEYKTNAQGDNYIYVYRPDVTDPEAGKDYISGTSTNTVYNAALDVENGETGYGSTDLSLPYTANTLYYSDGQNSGIKISNATLSADGNELTFTIDFADYESANVWDIMGDGISSNMYGEPVIYADPDTGTVYMAYAEGISTSYNVVVKKWDGTSWVQVGTTVTGGMEPQIIVNSGTLYLSYQNSLGTKLTYCKLSGSSWVKVKEISATYGKNMQFIEDAANLYIAYVETSGNVNRLVIRDLKKDTLITNTLTLQEFGNPSVCKCGPLFYVAYSDFFATGGSNKARIDAYDTSSKTWTTVHKYNIGATNTHIIKAVNGKIYAFVGGYDVPPVVTIYDGAQWIDTTVSQMAQCLDVSMDIIEDEVYISYIDSEKYKARVLRKDGGNFTVYYDNLGTGSGTLSTCTYNNKMYAATKAVNATTAYVKSQNIVLPEYKLTLTPPSGYTDANIYIDGIAYPATANSEKYTITLPHSEGRTAVMYYYDSSGVPRGMYVWTLKYGNGAYTATAQSGLQDLISYHGFSIRVSNPAGIRFKSGISQTLRTSLLGSGVNGFKLVEYGTLMMTNANRASYPFVKLGRKSASGRSYWTENETVNDKIFETVSGRIRFASVLTGLPASQYNTEFAFRGYIILEKNGERYIIYGMPVSRSVYTVAKQIQARGEFTVGSSGYKFIQGIIDSVEGN